MQFNIKLHKLPMSELFVFYCHYCLSFFKSASIDFSFVTTWRQQNDCKKQNNILPHYGC